jgi:type IV pilus assembly protein PilC
MASRLRLKTLSGFSRQLGTMLDAGLPIRRSLGVVERSARQPMKGICQRVGIAIEQGASLSEALEREGRAFPVLYIRLIHMGETVGGLDKVFKRLADYYEFVRAMWMRLITQLIWPLCEFWAMIFVLAALSYIRNMFLQDHGSPKGALMILGAGALIFFAPIAAYIVLTRTIGGNRFVHEILIRVPVIGAVFRTLALARFSWSMELMTDSGVPIYNSLQWSMQATANGAFEGRLPGIVQRIKDGTPLAKSLEMSGLFPIDYIEMMHVAEESGSMPDTFARLAKNYFDQADRAIRALVTALGWLIWICVASVIIYYIFTMALGYRDMITNMTRDAGG